jgi:hypothetical protein
MTQYIGEWGIGLRDLRGKIGRVKGYYKVVSTTTAGVGDAVVATNQIAAAVVAMSNGVPVKYDGLISAVANPNAYGSNAEFPNAEDKAVLTFLMADHSFNKFSIPAPKSAIFLSDLETVDLTNSLVLALNNALQAVDAVGGEATSKNGSFFSVIIAGQRSRRRFQRQTTIWTLNPELTSPEE